MNHDKLIGRLAPVTDEEIAHMVSPQTKTDLAERIMTTAADTAPAPRRRRRLVLFGLPLAVATAAATVAAVTLTGSSGSPTPTTSLGPQKVQPAALSFSTRGKYLVVKVEDPLADPARYKKEFAAHGMDITLKVVPASPSVVGTVVMTDLPANVKMIPAKGKCYSGGGACPVGVRIPVGFHGSGAIVFGRAARPGEQYNSTNSAFAPGEALHCVNIRGLTVDQALPILRRHKVAVGQWHYDEKRPTGPYGVTTPNRGKIAGSWYVTDADPWAPGQVLLWTQPTMPKLSPGATASQRRLAAGCPR
ncbi:hypothetical protein [Actinoallomurus sp. CA-142502]|uniref:hypothetical protein n=1 Tax=Actinoallomurus sp. CA-142502 TaxID=3239885 RepID=UPI003D8CEA96